VQRQLGLVLPNKKEKVIDRLLSKLNAPKVASEPISLSYKIAEATV
jgi:hypothetical protein